MKLCQSIKSKLLVFTILFTSAVTIFQFQRGNRKVESEIAGSKSADFPTRADHYSDNLAERELVEEIAKEGHLADEKPMNSVPFGMSWIGDSYPDSLKEQRTIPELVADRELNGVILTPDEMREVHLEQRIVLEGEAIGVGAKSATSLHLRYGKSSDTDMNRSCFIGGEWSLPQLTNEARQSGRFYWVRIECKRVDCRDIDFAEFCIDDIKILGASVVTADEVDQTIHRSRGSLKP